MKRLHIVGRKNSGKTTLVTDLVRYLSSRGAVVGTVKHTHHQHELDTPGKDSHRHRQAGARVSGILSPGLNAVFFPPREPHDAPDRYEAIAPLYTECDVVLVEGNSQTTAAKVEVWRAAVGAPPLAAEDRSILAVVTDDALSLDVPTWPRSDLRQIIAHLWPEWR